MEKQKVIDRVVLLVAVVAVASSAYFYYQWNLLKQNPQAVAQAEVSSLVAKVSKLVALPEETPTIATVADVEALKSQPFFAKAVKGDKVLIYPTAKKAYLYSVEMNKLLEVAPLNIGESARNTGGTQ